MLIETWVAVLIIIFTFILGMGCLLGWILADQRLEQEIEENKSLRKEKAQLKNKMNRIRFYIEMEEKK